jgi:hypothetical protein
MRLKQHPLRIVALTMSSLIAASLSQFYWGGFLVFAGRAKTLTDVCYGYVPVLAFPVALLAWWKSRLGACLWVLITLLFFGAQFVIAWPRLTAVVDTQLISSLLLFLVVGILLVSVAVFDRRQSSSSKA